MLHQVIQKHSLPYSSLILIIFVVLSNSLSRKSCIFHLQLIKAPLFRNYYLSMFVVLLLTYLPRIINIFSCFLMIFQILFGDFHWNKNQKSPQFFISLSFWLKINFTLILSQFNRIGVASFVLFPLSSRNLESLT